jgi:hypothetical protein
VAESLEDRLFQGLQGLLFVLVPREDGKGQGDAVPFREHPHLHDRVRSVLLALSIFFASVFLLYLKAIVRAVVVKDAVIPVYLEAAVLIGFRLYEVALGGKHVQGAVDIMLLIGRLFKIVHCCPVGGAFASRLPSATIKCRTWQAQLPVFRFTSVVLILSVAVYIMISAGQSWLTEGRVKWCITEYLNG